MKIKFYNVATDLSSYAQGFTAALEWMINGQKNYDEILKFHKIYKRIIEHEKHNNKRPYNNGVSKDR